VPAKNPGSGEPNLFPVYEKEGAWFISPRNLSAVKGIQGLKEGLITDTKSGKLGQPFANPTAFPVSN
jgi:hypothetical protein